MDFLLLYTDFRATALLRCDRTSEELVHEWLEVQL